MFFTLNPLLAGLKPYVYPDRYDEFTWASENLVRLADTADPGARQLVDTAGTKQYECDGCKDDILTSSQALIELGIYLQLKPRKGDGWDQGSVLKNSDDLVAISLRGDTLIGIHNNQFRVWI
jgi:hypothetical protein